MTRPSSGSTPTIWRRLIDLSEDDKDLSFDLEDKVDFELEALMQARLQWLPQRQSGDVTVLLTLRYTPKLERLEPGRKRRWLI